ncbi:MAG TPA: imidazoleglycerol-phosphate dehydratase HisB [Holophaga sp.]|nr:imidazoleglycerol-phosphate dehydratase HisB [Holophaga sp.]
MRRAEIQRKTKETDIRLELCLDGGAVDIQTGLGFFDHMLDQIARHGGFGLTVKAKGDLQIDSHHLVEDVGLCLGDALREALGDRRGIARFGEAYAPMDETLARVVVDLSGRSYCVFDVELPAIVLGDGFQTEMVREFLVAFSTRGALNLHASVLYGANVHHRIEATFKALARALKQAVRVEGTEIASTKGSLTV